MYNVVHCFSVDLSSLLHPVKRSLTMTFRFCCWVFFHHNKMLPLNWGWLLFAAHAKLFMQCRRRNSRVLGLVLNAPTCPNGHHQNRQEITRERHVQYNWHFSARVAGLCASKGSNFSIIAPSSSSSASLSSLLYRWQIAIHAINAFHLYAHQLMYVCLCWHPNRIRSGIRKWGRISRFRDADKRTSLFYDKFMW